MTLETLDPAVLAGEYTLPDEAGYGAARDAYMLYGKNWRKAGANSFVVSSSSRMPSALHNQGLLMSTTVDFQCMRASRNTIGQEFVNAYKYEVGASKPEEDFDDRNALYSLLICLASIQAAFQN